MPVRGTRGQSLILPSLVSTIAARKNFNPRSHYAGTPKPFPSGRNLRRNGHWDGMDIAFVADQW